MVTATNGAQNTSVSPILLSTTTPSVTSSSFTQQLAAALENYLGQSGNSSNLEIDIQPSGSQNSGGSQFLVTVKTVSPIAAAQSSSVATTVATRAADTGASGSSPAASVSSAPAGSTPGPDGMENIPFGNSISTEPTLDAELAAFNHDNSILAKINPDALSNTVAQAGDPNYGKNIPGSSLKWNDLTQDQQIAFQHATIAGLPAGQTMDQYLSSYVGPKAWWNASYSNPAMFGSAPALGSTNMHSTPYIDVNG